jgi:hypothetical protein
MANKYFRQNLNKGGGADTGKVGERKSSIAVAMGKLKKRLKRKAGRFAPVTGIKGLLDRKPSTIKNKTSKSPMERQRKLDTLKSEAAKTGGKVMSMDEMKQLKGESDKSYESRMKKVFEAKKGGRAALKMGTKKNFNEEEREIQKKVDRDALIFGAKKAIERAKNKENKSAKMKQVFDSKRNKNIFATDSQIINNPDRFKPIKSIIKMLKASDKAIANKRVMNYLKSKEPGGRFSEKDIELAKKALGMKKGGRAALKKGSKFPDLTGDGKVTRADILKGRGVFSKGSKPKNIKDLTRARLGQFTIAGKLLKKKFGGGSK